jgi:hypothetical protein
VDRKIILDIRGKETVIFTKIENVIIVSRIILKALTGNFAASITLWPIVFLRDKKHLDDPILINHEKIHLRQQLELLIFIFYLWYGIEYLVYRFKGMSAKSAYRNIRFEKEAYQYEENPDYLKSRKWFAYVRR